MHMNKFTVLLVSFYFIFFAESTDFWRYNNIVSCMTVKKCFFNLNKISPEVYKYCICIND